MALRDMIVVGLGILLAAGAVFYGLAKLPPGDWRRWLVYGAGAVVVTQFAWYPIVSVWCTYPVTTVDQHVATMAATALLKVTAERVIPLGLRAVEESEESDEREPLQSTG